METQRKRKDIPPLASYKPEDAKYLNTIYKHIFNIKVPIITEEDQQKMQILFDKYNELVEKQL